jgi:hypothetical protein
VLREENKARKSYKHIDIVKMPAKERMEDWYEYSGKEVEVAIG